MSRTVLDKEERRSQLVDAAIKVFAQKGYRSAAITDIIEAAGVARGTFYLYFDSKLAVFHAVMDRYFELFQGVVDKELARSYTNPLMVRARIRESLMEWFQLFAQNQDLAKVVFREANAIEPDFESKVNAMLYTCFSHWQNHITKFQKVGFIKKGVDPHFLSVIFSGIVLSVVLHYIIPEEKPDLDRIVDQWLDLLESGIRTKGWLG